MSRLLLHHHFDDTRDTGEKIHISVNILFNDGCVFSKTQLTILQILLWFFLP